jgi:prevent-host-death family protein
MASLPKSDLSDTFGLVTRMTATEVARSFSDVLNRVAGGEEIEVTRNGATVAVIRPAAKPRLISPERMNEIFDSLPPFDDDFIKDLEEIRRSVGPPPSGDPWDT